MPTTAQQIAGALRTFDAWFHSQTAAWTAATLLTAYNELAGVLNPLGIVYGDQVGSKANCPAVRGLLIGEVLDLMHTLHQGAGGAIPNFQATRFREKVLQLIGIFDPADDDDDDA